MATIKITDQLNEKISLYKRKNMNVMVYVRNPEWNKLGHLCPSSKKTWWLLLMWENGRYIYDDLIPSLTIYLKSNPNVASIDDEHFDMYCYVKAEQGCAIIGY